jgi:hypothetical protein
LDVIERFLTSAVREVLEKVLGKRGDPYEFVEMKVVEAEDFAALLEALVADGRYAEAEDFLFAQYERTPSVELYAAGMEAFTKMSALSETDLAARGYSHAEIEKARRDFELLSEKLKPDEVF